MWTTQDIDWVDAAFAEMVRRTNNNSLVRTASGGEMTFVRYGNLVSGTAVDGWNGNGRIALTQNGFNNGRNTILRNVLHEVGHNWDEEYDAAGWRALSGWTTSNPGTNPAYAKGTNQNQAWWYLTSAAFASTYARTDPNEDFAESFAEYFMQRAGQTSTANAIPAKISFVDRMCGRKTTA
jgi:hypothetical protein